MQQQTRQAGFTIVELMTAMAFIAVLLLAMMTLRPATSTINAISLRFMALPSFVLTQFVWLAHNS